MRSDDRVKRHVRKSLEAGEVATLTDYDWEITLRDFHHRCAYCLVGDYEVLEHVIPGAGTTVTNCVPACRSCNTAKDRPNRIWLGDPKKAAEALTRVNAYFASRGSGPVRKLMFAEPRQEVPDPLYSTLKDQVVDHGNRVCAQLDEARCETFIRDLVYLYGKREMSHDRQAIAVAVSLLAKKCQEL